MPGRALRLAATAFGTAGHIQQALPRDITAGTQPKDIIFGRIFKIYRLTFREHFRERTQSRLVNIALVVDIEEG